eukprot:Platyproteum_vivax@DN5946_c0_g1_i2.p1
MEGVMTGVFIATNKLVSLNSSKSHTCSINSDGDYSLPPRRSTAASQSPVSLSPFLSQYRDQLTELWNGRLQQPDRALDVALYLVLQRAPAVVQCLQKIMQYNKDCDLEVPICQISNIFAAISGDGGDADASWLWQDFGKFGHKEWRVVCLFTTTMLSPAVATSGLFLNAVVFKTGISWTCFNTFASEWHLMDFVPLQEDSTSGVYLGVTPCAFRDFFEQVRSHKISAVLGMVEVYETITNSEGLLSEKFRDCGIDYLLVPTRDFDTAGVEEIHLAVSFIHYCLSKKKVMYIHCKAEEDQCKHLSVTWWLTNTNPTCLVP